MGDYQTHPQWNNSLLELDQKTECFQLQALEEYEGKQMIDIPLISMIYFIVIMHLIFLC